MTKKSEIIYDELELRHPLGYPEYDGRVHNLGGAFVNNELRRLRDKNTSQEDFCDAIAKLSIPVLLAALSSAAERRVLIDTPLAPIYARELAKEPVVVAIKRAGLGMKEATKGLLPEHTTYLDVDLARDEKTAIAHWHEDLPQVKRLGAGATCEFYILDPMLATGGTASQVVEAVKTQYPQASIKMLALISAHEGLDRFHTDHPDIDIYTTAIDDHLNDKAYIVPGLGDAGDRQFGPRT